MKLTEKIIFALAIILIVSIFANGYFINEREFFEKRKEVRFL